MVDAPAIPNGSTPAATPSNSPFTVPINPEAQRLAAAPPKEVTRIEAPKQPTPTEWLRMSPTDRAAYQRTVTDAGRTSASVHTRTPDGRPLIDGKLPDGSVYQPDGENAPVDSAAPADTGEKVKVGEFETTEAELRDLLAGKAERDLARADVPAQPTDYKIEIPATADLPEGTAVAIKNDQATAAMIDAAQRWAHKNGLSQAAFNELVAIQAHGVIAEQQNYARLSAANLEALGARGPQRIDAFPTRTR